MAGIRVKVEGSIDRALRQFKKKCIDSGLLMELKRRAYYEKPSEERRRLQKKKERTIKGPKLFLKNKFSFDRPKSFSR
ncbi:MAG: 30S ribosomal protein S21 [Planctomycetes bacterium]|nr:30S ribosomal protein S21 [Planctomycetota bacterium]